MTLVLLNLVFAVVAVACALRFGGEEERTGAKIIVVMYLIAVVGRTWQGSVFHTLDPFAFAQDALALLCFSALGINTKRIWPLWAAAFQLLSVGAHIIRAFELDVRPIVYAWMKSGPTWAVVLLLLIGTLGHHRRTSMSASGRFWPN